MGCPLPAHQHPAGCSTAEGLGWRIPAYALQPIGRPCSSKSPALNTSTLEPKARSIAAGSDVVTSSAVLLVRTATWPCLLGSVLSRAGRQRLMSFIALLGDVCSSSGLSSRAGCRQPLRHRYLACSLVLSPPLSRPGPPGAACSERCTGL